MRKIPLKGVSIFMMKNFPKGLRKFFIIKRKRVGLRKNKKDFEIYKTKALDLAINRIEYFNKVYNFKFYTIRIKDASTRWGSCSSKGNLNFNYRIALLPEKISDYIIVHELCHLGEFNHSQKFWDLVAKTVPDYMQIRAELKSIGMKIG